MCQSEGNTRSDLGAVCFPALSKLIVRVESSERWASHVSMVSSPVSYIRWLNGQVMSVALYLLHISTYSFFAKLRYWKHSKSKWVIDNCIQPCLSMKTAFLGFLPTLVSCQEKMLWALQMIWPHSGLVLVLHVIEKNESFWLSNYLANFAPGVCTILCCFYTPFMNLWFYVYTNMWRKMLKTSFLINMLG